MNILTMGRMVDTFDPENIQAGENVGLDLSQLSLACNVSGVSHV